MKLTPIPKLLLSESVSVRVPVADDYGTAWSDDVQELRHVRIEQAESLLSKGYVLSDGCKAVMYVDAVNSSGLLEIPVGSLVQVSGDWLAASAVTPYEVGGTIHHWEVTLR